MVFVNSRKYACASCVMGHRSSSCSHSDRPLFEIKKKGRPISQCNKCRELRKNKRMHVKCTCGDAAPSQSGSSAGHLPDATRSTPRRPAPRKLPSAPTLPNGLQDLWSQDPSPSDDSHPKQRVDALLNPCNCKSLYKCRCPGRGKTMPSVATFAHDESATSPVVPQFLPSLESDDVGNPLTSTTRSTLSHITTPATASPHPSALKYPVRNIPDPEPDIDHELDLPPLKCCGSSDADICADGAISRKLPSLKHLCPLPSEDTTEAKAVAVASLTRCGCGSACACPGCIEHRGRELASQSGEDCPDKCGSCVDHMGGIALPTPCSITHSSRSSHTATLCHVSSDARSHSHALGERVGMSTLDHFHAIAALLPPPPPGRVSYPIDPTNVAVYKLPSDSKPNWSKAAGFVQLPPLNCCDGKCKCPGGRCGCGTECGGSCGRGEHSDKLEEVRPEVSR